MKAYDACKSEVIAKDHARQLKALGHKVSIRYNPVSDLYEIFVDEGQRTERGPKHMEDAFRLR